MSSIVEYQIIDNVPQTVFYTPEVKEETEYIINTPAIINNHGPDFKKIKHEIEHEQGIFCCSFIRKLILFFVAVLILLVIFKIIKKLCKNKKHYAQIVSIPSPSVYSTEFISPHSLSELLSPRAASLIELPSMLQ